MNYWKDRMNWNLDKDWTCVVCGARELTWGMAHARCRCDNCHAEYKMRDTNEDIVMVPIWQCKEEYRNGLKEGWKELQKPVSEWTELEIAKFLGEVK